MGERRDQFKALNRRHSELADLFRSLKAAGHYEAAEAAFLTSQRVWDEAQSLYVAGLDD